MQINPIQQNRNNPSFKIKLSTYVSSKHLTEKSKFYQPLSVYYQHLKANKNNPHLLYNTSKQLDAYEKIIYALEQHPSKRTIFAKMLALGKDGYYYKFQTDSYHGVHKLLDFDGEVKEKALGDEARGFLYTNREGKYASPRIIKDVQHALLTKPEQAMQHILVKFLDPDNKNIFHRLIEPKFLPEYDNWWNTYIKPHWENIQEAFKDVFPFELLDAKNISREQFNKNFRTQTDITERLVPDFFGELPPGD